MSLTLVQPTPSPDGKLIAYTGFDSTSDTWVDSKLYVMNADGSNPHVISGMLEFVFIHDGTRGAQLLVLTLSLAIFAIHVPLLMGYTVARYPVVYE